MGIWGRNIPCRENSKCKDPEVDSHSRPMWPEWIEEGKSDKECDLTTAREELHHLLPGGHGNSSGLLGSGGFSEE